MRKQLKQVNGIRATFRGTFERYGSKTSFGHFKQTLLLKDIYDCDAKLVADHLWFNLTKGFARVGLQEGDTVGNNILDAPND